VLEASLLLRNPTAARLLAAAVIAMVLGEVAATYVGQARDGRRRPFGAVGEALLLLRRRGGQATEQDRGTVWVFVVASRAAVFAALAIALVPRLRAYANDWWTLGIGMAMVLAGTALRSWSIVSLGRYFRRKVTIEPGQTIVRRGPYRLLRHPSYAGLLLAITGLGLMFGSWVGAVVALVVMLVGMVPRMRVEEAALARTFGDEYDRYARTTWRLVPYVW
jgi:protein-S-isoprenylcysteine O-methyltransferase Ste14